MMKRLPICPLQHLVDRHHLLARPQVLLLPGLAFRSLPPPEPGALRDCHVNPRTMPHRPGLPRRQAITGGVRSMPSIKEGTMPVIPPQIRAPRNRAKDWANWYTIIKCEKKIPPNRHQD